MIKQDVSPQYGLQAFNCPHCGAYSTQSWLMSSHLRGRKPAWGDNVKDVAISICQLCGESAVWIEDLNSLQPIGGSPGSPSNSGSLPPPRNTDIPKAPTKGRLVYPTHSLAPVPSEDMPDEIRHDYMEAREILRPSPRGAAALLRLCVEKLMHLLLLDEKGKNINEDIAVLVRRGLPVKVQQALDSVRVIGNEAVHPGTMDLNDDRETALKLFDLLNIIVEIMITQPRRVEEVYNKLPSDKREAISKRDNP